jgi:hypothetical protein
MPGSRPLLMIPGPIEISPAVERSFAGPPPGHLAPRVIEAFGSSLAMMRRVWQARPESQPFVVTGGGSPNRVRTAGETSTGPGIMSKGREQDTGQSPSSSHRTA